MKSYLVMSNDTTTHGILSARSERIKDELAEIDNEIRNVKRDWELGYDRQTGAIYDYCDYCDDLMDLRAARAAILGK